MPVQCGRRQCQRAAHQPFDLADAPLVVGERAQVLGACLEQRALRIQHIEEAELAELVSLGGGVEGALRAGQQNAAQGLDFLANGGEALVGLRQIRQQTALRRALLVARLVEAPAGFQDATAVAVEERQRQGDADLSDDPDGE